MLSILDFNKLLQEVFIEERLQALLKDRPAVEQKLEKIDVLPQKLRAIHHHVQELKECVEQTCGLAQGVSG